MFAIIQLAGKQFIVSPGDTILVPRQQGKVGDKLQIPDVLLVSDGGKTSIGKPMVKGVTVDAKILSQKKGKKLIVRRFKSKVRYRKTRGFREQLTELEIVKIG